MDFATKEIFKRYASIMIGKPISPVFLNILVTSVCDMRCTHCFFTEELDDRPRKKLQMKADEIGKISETLGGNLGVLVLAGGEPFTRKDLPEIVKSFYDNNKLDSVYLMSNGQIHQRIFPDVNRSPRHRRDEKRPREDPPQGGKLGQGDPHGPHAAADETGAVSASRHPDVHLRDAFERGHHLRLVRFPQIRPQARQGEH
jgi:hypothetical protein